MNRRSLLKLLPVAALGGLWARRSNTQSTMTVIESPRGTRKVLVHRESRTGRRFQDVQLIRDDIPVYLRFDEHDRLL